MDDCNLNVQTILQAQVLKSKHIELGVGEMEHKFSVGDKVEWMYRKGWGGGSTGYAKAEIIKINPVKIKIKVWRKVGNETREEIKSVMPSSLIP